MMNAGSTAHCHAVEQLPLPYVTCLSEGGAKMVVNSGRPDNGTA